MHRPRAVACSTFLFLANFFTGLHAHAASTDPSAFEVVPRGQISVSHPSFLALYPSQDRGAAMQLFISSFGVFGGDAVSVLPNVNETVQRGRLAQAIVPLTHKVTWPNEVAAVDAPLFKEPGYVVAGGFLVPGKGNGALTYLNGKTFEQHTLTTPKKGFFYHRVKAVHWGPNKSLALLTARAHKPMFGESRGELVLLTPRQGATALPFAFDEQVIATGPDVFFAALDLDGDGVEELVTSNFFSKDKSIQLYWFDGTQLQHRLLDNTVGTPFDLEFADLMGNGRQALVLTNHEGGQRGAVYAYEIPKDWKSAAWPRHTLLAGIQTRQGGPGAASPGAPVVFYPGEAAGKPWILVAGDGSQRAHLLTPNSADATDWGYTESIVADVRGTVGKVAVGDVDGDGHPEIFVPAYDGNKILMFSVKPRP